VWTQPFDPLGACYGVFPTSWIVFGALTFEAPLPIGMAKLIRRLRHNTASRM